MNVHFGGVNKNSKWIFNRQDEKYQRPEYKCSIEQKQQHPTQKPLKLMEEIIKIHTNEKMIVLDPFMGSGTTCIACQNINRNFIGIELDEKYYDIALNRIEKNEK